MKHLLSLSRFLKPYKKWAFLAPFLILFEAIMEITLPNIMADIINVGIANQDITYIVLRVVLMLVLTIVGVLGGIGSTYYAAQASSYMSSDLRKEVFEKISHLSFFRLDQLKTGHLITILTNDISLIGMVMVMGLRMVFRVPIILIGSLIIAILISPKLSLILLVIVPIMLVTVICILKKAFPKFQEMQDRLDDVNTNIRENIGGIRVVKSFVMENHEIGKFDNTNKALRDTTIKAVRIITLAMPVIMLLINIGVIFVLWYGGNQVMAGSMQIGDIIAFIQYLSNILSALMMASMIFLMLSRSEASAVRIKDTLNLEDDFISKDICLTTPNITGKVEFRNVSFAYQGGTGDAVLKNINIIINPGETIAILGSTGSGKTTLINLIPRFYDATSGEVLIDDINVKTYDIAFLRKQVSVAFQTPTIFSGTIADNLRYGNEQATDEEMMKACEVSQIADFITSKKKGLYYHIEQKGANLSGGQKQRLSIARAIVANPQILILDDTTSAVDLKTEKMIRHNLEKIFKGRTTIIVAQRISSCMTADRIIVMDDGMINGIGTHQELLKNNTIYQEIYHSQIEEGDNHGRN